MTDDRMMYQEATFPDALEKLVEAVRFPGMTFSLEECTRFHARGLTLVIVFEAPDTYNQWPSLFYPVQNPEEIFRSRRMFEVPAIYQTAKEWKKWLFDRVQDVMMHEMRENFVLIDGEVAIRPFSPTHRAGANTWAAPE